MDCRYPLPVLLWNHNTKLNHNIGMDLISSKNINNGKLGSVVNLFHIPKKKKTNKKQTKQQLTFIAQFQASQFCQTF